MTENELVDCLVQGNCFYNEERVVGWDRGNGKEESAVIKLRNRFIYIPLSQMRKNDLKREGKK